MADEHDLIAWAESGAMALTGPVDGAPAIGPAGVVTAVAAATADLASMTARFGRAVHVDGPALLGERAALAGLTRQGSVSVGGAARFERVADGWVVLNLPRPEDVDALPALLEAPLEAGDWASIRAALATKPAAELIDRGRLLGLAIARPDERPQLAAPGRELHRGPDRPVRARPLVLDFSSLWAGPLAGAMLVDAGARVIKVEGSGRPDGARLGPAAFFDLLNAGKEAITVDLRDRGDQQLIHRMVAAADLVIEASRPRALGAIGLDPTEAVDRSGTSWVSITGHGRTDDPDRVGFGDDAAVAGGLWLDGPDAPMFVADAVADPVTGIAAAALAAELLAAERAAAIEVPLSRVAAWARTRTVTGSVLAIDDGWAVDVSGERVGVAAPRARPSRGVAAEIDAHGPALRAEFSER